MFQDIPVGQICEYWGKVAAREAAQMLELGNYRTFLEQGEIHDLLTRENWVMEEFPRLGNLGVLRECGDVRRVAKNLDEPSCSI